MAAFLTLMLLAGLIALVLLADAAARQTLRLRWAFSRHSYIVQRQTLFGLWLPYGRLGFPDSTAAEQWITEELVRHKAECGDRFGPVHE